MDPGDPAATVVDCLDQWGRPVIGRRRRWEGHVVPWHAELDEHFDAVRATVEDPEMVRFDATYPAARTSTDSARYPVTTGASGTLITAYPTGIIGRREAQTWP